MLKILIPVVLVCCQFVLPAEQKKFRVELSGIYQFVNPTHLNYLTETEQSYLLFYFDPVYDSKTEQGAFDSVKALYSINARVKYALTPSLNISLGLSYLWKNQTSEYNVTYTRDEEWRTISDALEYPEMDEDGIGSFSLSFITEKFECQECGLRLEDYDEMQIAGVDPDIDRSDESDQWQKDHYSDYYDYEPW